MAGLPFRLATLLSLREAQLTEAMQEMTRLETLVKVVEDSLEQVRQERDENYRRTVPSLGSSVADLRLTTEYLGVLEHRERELLSQSNQLQNKLSRARTALRERHQAVDILQRLRQKHALSVQQATLREEQRGLDELAGLRADRQQRQKETS